MKKLKKITLVFFLLLIIVLMLTIFFSPFGKHPGSNQRLIVTTVEINAPVDTVFNYLGNSEHAKQWSVFVHHITPLNSDSFPDGIEGGRRRCFCNADEKGTQWDELITEVIPGKKRQLVIYAMKDFFMSADDLATDQMYEVSPNGKCRLSFTLFFKEAKPGLWDLLKTYIAAYRIRSIFERNLNNIKGIIERTGSVESSVYQKNN